MISDERTLAMDIAQALGWQTEFLAGENRITSRLVLEGVENVVRSRKLAWSLLRHIGGARTNFSMDPGGPADPAEGMVVIEGWISNYFKVDALALPGIALAQDSRSRDDLLAEIAEMKRACDGRPAASVPVHVLEAAVVVLGDAVSRHVHASEAEIAELKIKLAESERIRAEYIRETIVGGPMRRGQP